jgi:hypothetical protein
MDFTTFTFFVTNMALLAAGLFLWIGRDNVNPMENCFNSFWYGLLYSCYSLLLYERKYGFY